MSKLTPYDTGERAEPRPWQAHHRETEEDFGKVDFDAEDGFTLATLWIERQSDGTYALAGYTNVALKVTVESNDPGDDEITVTMPEADRPEGTEEQLDRLEFGAGQPQIQIRNPEAATEWINITSEQQLAIESILRGEQDG